MANTQNPSIHDPRFEKFTIPSLNGFSGDDRDKLLLSSESSQEITVVDGTVLPLDFQSVPLRE